MSRAAENLSLSKALARLELRIGTRMLHRRTDRLFLTESDRLALDRAARLLADADTIESDVCDWLVDVHGVVRLTGPISIGIRTLGNLLPTFLSLYAKVKIDPVLPAH